MSLEIRLLLGLVVAILTMGGVAIGQTLVTEDGPEIIPDDAACVEVLELHVQSWNCTRPFDDGTTTTTEVTTTTEETTTTTEQATTTTTEATTTTTPPSTGLVIPETLPYPGNLKANDGFQFMIACADDVKRGEVLFTCVPNADGKGHIATFTYMGHGMPYLHPDGTPGYHVHPWWFDGDREGYRCGYGFMADQHPNPFGMFPEDRPYEFTHRATIVRPVNAGYGALNDKYMDEGVRYYDGSPATQSGNEIPDEDCQSTALDDFDYDNYIPVGHQDIRVGLFIDGNIGDIRDFTDISVAYNSDGAMGHFEFIGLENGRATIVFVLAQNNKVSHVFYYDILSPRGQIGVEVNGVMVAP